MNITFRTGSESISERLIQRTEAKLHTFTRYIIEQNYEAQVHVAIERESGSQSSESLWSASINLDLAGNRFNANGKGNTPDKAAGIALKELKRELQKSKARQQSIVKRGTGILKRLRQGFN